MVNINEHNEAAVRQLIEEWNRRISSIDERVRGLETSLMQLRNEVEQGRNSSNLERARTFTLPDRVSSLETDVAVLRREIGGAA